MTAAIDILEALATFVVGLAGRLGVFLVAGLALAMPALAIALVWRAIERRRGRGDVLGFEACIAPNHTWLSPRRDGTLTVGVDEIAQRILPSATAVELPRRGMRVHRGDPIVVIRAGRRAVRIGSPVDGTVAAVNRRLRREPQLLKDEPYGRGWLYRIESDDETWKKLPSGLWADTWLLAETRRLASFVEDELGVAAADGGELVAPAPALLGEEGWNKVVSAFLSAA